MVRPAVIIVAVLAFIASFADLVFGDEGMWLLNQPPVEALKEKYGFEPTAGWLEHLQKSSVKMGASGSFVSAEGLVMTNHHVGSGQIRKLSTKECDLLRDGFLAATRDEEMKCPDMEMRVLWEIRDVTERVVAASGGETTANGASGAPERATEFRASTSATVFAARRRAMTAIEQEAEKESGLDCEVVTLYQGARYHLYCYKRFTDVRLVMAPEKQIAFYGGDNDNFEYPRFDLDMCFFRVYENGRPYRPEHYLKWSTSGAKEGELVFVAGHPARTRRMNTVDHLRFLRDVDMPWNLRYQWRREVQLHTFVGRSAENQRLAMQDLYGVQNGRKAATGTYMGLLDPAMMNAKIEGERALRAAVMKDPARQAEWGDAWDKLASALEGYKQFHNRHNALRRSTRSDLLGRAITIVQLAEELPKPSEARLREYRESAMDSVLLDLYSPEPIHDVLEIDRLTSGLAFLAEALGADDPLVVAALAGMSPRARAEQLVGGCTLKELVARKALVEGGKAAVAGTNDPMVKLAAILDPELRALRKRHEDEVESVERECYAKVAAARFAMHGERLPPDATGTLRLSYGVIRGYKENWNDVAPFTTFGGLFRRHDERGGKPPYQLDDRWNAAKGKLNLETPFNFVCTADIIGGNSGSPVVNKEGEVVGLIFDGNIQSLVWDIAFTEEQGRAVAVDSRGMIEALRKVYGADALAEEILGLK